MWQPIEALQIMLCTQGILQVPTASALVRHMARMKTGYTQLGFPLCAANILVRYLGEEGERTPIRAAISMCNPFNLVRHFAA